jgi:predicted hotdog family 3-hydroxylacyl-ACP dehydratase
MKGSLNFPIAAERLIPHRPHMCLIDRLLSYDGLRGVVEAILIPGHIGLQEDGSMVRAAMVELIAQSFGAVKGYADSLDGKPIGGRGFLVGVKQFTFLGSAYVKDRLLITITRTGEADEFALAEGRVTREEEVLAFGNIMVWVPREV